MNDADRYWKKNSGKLRRFKGLAPLTPEEAEAALSKIPPREMPDDELDFLVDAIVGGEIPEPELHRSTEWSPDSNFSEVDCEAVLFRNEGDADPEAKQLEEELLKELLDDAEPEDDATGLEE